MADLTITAANVLAGSGSKKVNGTAGATVTAGQVVYLDSATDTYKLADNDSGTAAVRSPAGIALHASLSGQPLTILTAGSITIGATTAIGTVYCLSSTAGGICPSADIATGDYNTILGIGTSVTAINVKIHEAGAAVA
jgi:hypothetical protein